MNANGSCAAWLVVFFCGAGWGAPFSHQLHLQLKLQCVSCHTAAASSARVEDNLLPSEPVCRGCHAAGPIAIKTPRSSPVAKFSHQQHLKMGNVAPVIARAIDSKQYLSPPGDERRFLDTKNACEACHRGLEESTQVSEANFPRMADCLVCHNKIDVPFSCETCHASSFKLVPASHVQGWIDNHSTPGAKLDKESCAVCHGRRFTCRGCH
jgi:hypothetical protein